MTPEKNQEIEFERYRNTRFSARFPKSFRFSRSHYWMAPIDLSRSLWHVGFTKFATRMLGELVEAEFELTVGADMEPGAKIGWVEGFKAASDVYSVMAGSFCGMNPALAEDACIIRSSPYTDGYLYAAEGTPEESDLGVDEYMAHLDDLIEEMKKDPKYMEG